MGINSFTNTDNLNWPNTMDGRVHSVLKGLKPTCRDVAAPIRSPKDCATSEVWVASVKNMIKRVKSLGWDVIQYTILPYTSGKMIYK